MKKKIKKIKDKIVNFNYKEYARTNKLFLAFVISNLLNGMLLRFFTVKNFFAIKPILADLAVILLFGSFVYLFKQKKQFRYLMIMSFLFTLVCIINSLYYTYYMSFASFSLIAVSLTVVDVGDAVVKNVMEFKDFIFLWQLIFMIIYQRILKKHNYYSIKETKELRKKKFLGTIISGAVVYALFFITVTSVELSRLSKQWNREFLVTRFGVYTYQLNDLFKSLDAKFNTLFGYDNAAKEFREYYDENQIKLETNDYTKIFEGKNLILIHAESIQKAALVQSFNGKEVTPNLNRIKDEGIYFSNFYAQASSGTSSDSEFTVSTSLLPVTNGAVAVSYWNREYETLQKLLKDTYDYNILSFHANNGEFWNRNNFHKSLGYDTFYSKNSYEIEEENLIGLGLSDKEFFKQTVPLLKKEKDDKGKFMATLIMLSNHTPFDAVDKYGEFDVDIKEEKMVNENGQDVLKEVSYPYMENTKLGNYFKSVHYADEAIGELINELDEAGLLENTVVAIYGDHDAKLPKSEFVRLYNYDKETDSVLDEEDENYKPVDYYDYELNRSVPFIIWTKDKEFNKEVTTAMGMIDVMPTLSNMFGLSPKYALGKDVMNLSNNLVSFPNGNWLTNDIYYNSQKDEYKVINPSAIINSEEINKNNEISTKTIEISNDIILYDLIKNESSKERLDRVEGEN
ncbi:MAG: sulfatase-like hydrolase/transferase [Bacilli bacterium]|nr:sulfatase-like hydrolase/transferase [Bacilli bacterium]